MSQKNKSKTTKASRNHGNRGFPKGIPKILRLVFDVDIFKYLTAVAAFTRPKNASSGPEKKILLGDVDKKWPILG